MRHLTCVLLTFIVALGLACSGDGGGDDYNPYGDYESETYSRDSMWLCKPGIANDRCQDDISATEWTVGGALVSEPHSPASNPPVDCFYVYPTVAMESEIGNHTDFSDVRPMLDPLLNQVARFNSLCRVYAPLYRQITLATFGAPEADDFLEIAYADVLDAFKHYMSNDNEGRDIVIMGHSQGSMMVRRLLQREFDSAPEMRERMALGLLIGGDVEVPEDEVVGGSFKNIPLCTAFGEDGCVIAYRSYQEDFPPTEVSRFAMATAPGLEAACVNPGNPAGDQLYAAGYFPTFANQPIFDAGVELPPGVDTPFIKMADFYSGRCVRKSLGESGTAHYLEVRTTPRDDDARDNRIPFDAILFTPAFLGLHVLDYNFPMAELLAHTAAATGQ